VLTTGGLISSGSYVQDPNEFLRFGSLHNRQMVIRVITSESCINRSVIDFQHFKSLVILETFLCWINFCFEAHDLVHLSTHLVFQKTVLGLVVCPDATEFKVEISFHRSFKVIQIVSVEAENYKEEMILKRFCAFNSTTEMRRDYLNGE
jgi:hypothetical protein